jgi:hypothetical protein
MNNKYLNKTKLFEKIEIDWFSLEDIQKRRSEFRSFYQEITDHFLREKTQIRSFLQKAAKKNPTFLTKKRNKSRPCKYRNRTSKKSRKTITAE